MLMLKNLEERTKTQILVSAFEKGMRILYRTRFANAFQRCRLYLFIRTILGDQR